MEHDELDQDDMEATCRHGNFYNQVECEDCTNEEEIPNICEHDVDLDNDECAQCDAADERREQELRSEMEVTCEHDMEEDDCPACGAKMDALADLQRERDDFAHFHD